MTVTNWHGKATSILGVLILGLSGVGGYLDLGDTWSAVGAAGTALAIVGLMLGWRRQQ